MMPKNWLMLIVILLIGYFIGVKFPTTGTTVLGKVGL
jgi:hypothetical protein